MTREHAGRRLVAASAIGIGGGALAGGLVGGIIGWSSISSAHAASGSWRFALERAGVDAAAGVGALLGFVVVMSVVAWRVVASTLVGTVVGTVLGGVFGDLITADDPGAPVDWGALVGLGVGVVVGTVAGCVVGIALHLRRGRRNDDTSIGSRSLPEPSG